MSESKKSSSNAGAGNESSLVKPAAPLIPPKFSHANDQPKVIPFETPLVRDLKESIKMVNEIRADAVQMEVTPPLVRSETKDSTAGQHPSSSIGAADTPGHASPTLPTATSTVQNSKVGTVQSNPKAVESAPKPSANLPATQQPTAKPSTPGNVKTTAPPQAGSTPSQTGAKVGPGQSNAIPAASKVSIPLPPKAASASPASAPMSSLVSRVTSIMGQSAGKPPATLTSGDLSHPWAHVMLFGPPSSWKTSTAGLFKGPEFTRFIITRRPEQMIPLMGDLSKIAPHIKGKYTEKHYKVATDPEALRYAMLHADSIWPEWANLPEKTLVIDDVTEGVDLLVSDYKFYFNEKENVWVPVKDPRRAYGKAGEEMHDLVKIILGRRQHVILTAVEKAVEEEGITDVYIEPEIPNKVRKLFETELEYVFYMELGAGADPGKMLTKNKVVLRKVQENKREEIWREITYAKTKLPIELMTLTPPVLLPAEPKDLAGAWRKIQGALKSVMANNTSQPSVPPNAPASQTGGAK